LKCNEVEYEIIDNLLLDIRENKYSSDEKLPSDNEIAEKYGVPRIKVRNVYKRLEQMGYIYSLQGRGRFLKKRGNSIELILSGNESFSKKLKCSGVNLETINICAERVPYNEDIWKELRVSRHDPIYKIGRLRCVDKEPLAIHFSYVSQKVFEDISSEGKKITSMFDYYKKKGFFNYSTEKSILEVLYPTSKERKLLNCGELVPLIKLKSNCKDGDSDLILEYTEIIYRGDKFIYKIEY